MRPLLNAGVGLALAWLPANLLAQPSTTMLMEVLQINEVTSIMRDEGLRYAGDLNDDMLGGQGGGFWQQQVLGIYALPRMIEHVRTTLESDLDDTETTAIFEFFAQSPGSEIIARETLAREAMLTPDVEELARNSCLTPAEEDLEHIAIIDRFIETADLVERNVAGALSSNLGFYLGLVDGGMIDLPQDQILRDVYADEPDIRTETYEWLCGYFLLAYRPLPLDALESYVSFYGSPAGRALNAALFDGYNAMYREVSYALGRAIALNAVGDDI